jgi:hypothetical protein
MGGFVHNAAKFGSAPVPTRPGPLARIALGTLGLVLLFGLGYQISLRRRHSPAARNAEKPFTEAAPRAGARHAIDSRAG